VKIVDVAQSFLRFVSLFIRRRELFLISEATTLSVIRLSDGNELWNSDNLGTIDTAVTNTYQVILTGFKSPTINDRVLVVYYTNDLLKYQPFSFQNELINSKVSILQASGSKFTIPLDEITDDTVNFDILEPNTDIVLASITDGYIEDGYISSLTQNFISIYDILNKKAKITGATNANNNGFYDILSYDSLNNKLEISNVLDKITANQISIIRILDGCQSQLHVNFTNNELKQAYKYLMSLKCSVAGRFLWQLGTKNVSKLGIMSTYNALSVTSYNKFLNDVAALNVKYGKLTWYEKLLKFVLRKQFDKRMVVLDIPYLNNPPHQSVGILTEDFLESINDQIATMRDLGFYHSEIQKLERLLSIYQSNLGNDQVDNRKDFIVFVDEHDKRRGTNFLKTFPEMTEFYNLCKGY
jgi:hypothetical protein